MFEWVKDGDHGSLRFLGSLELRGTQFVVGDYSTWPAVTSPDTLSTDFCKYTLTTKDTNSIDDVAKTMAQKVGSDVPLLGYCPEISEGETKP